MTYVASRRHRHSGGRVACRVRVGPVEGEDTMKFSDSRKKFSRRSFLAGGALTVATVVAESRIAGAAATAGLKPEETRVLTRFVRDLFPHDQLEDSFYVNAIKPLQAESEKDPSVKRLLVAGVAQLNGLAGAAGGRNYADLSDEKMRIAAIRRVEHGPFFRKVYDTTIVSLYNQPALWPKFGYEGPSSPKGGYLRRGFNDLDWL
jgi:hypothetical protein